jgi:hypothetical protein
MMRKVQVVKSNEVEVKPLDKSRFLHSTCGVNLEQHITSDEVKRVATKLRLPCTDEKVNFTVQVMNAYVKKSELWR